MPDHHQGHDDEDPQNHDDCEDCKRQRAQNEKFIEIYEKLQQVDKRTSDVKGSIVLLQQQVDRQKEGVKMFDEKIQKAKHEKKEQNMGKFEEIGYNLYAETLVNARKSEAQKENQRLKAMLKKIYQDQNQKQIETTTTQISKTFNAPQSVVLPPLQLNESTQWFQKHNSPSRTQSQTQQSFTSTSMDKSFEIFSTKSSFNMTKRKTFEKKDFEELNLWLFEQRNQLLQKELYESKNKKEISNTQRHASLNKGVERYVNIAKNASRLGASTVLRTSMKKQTSLGKKSLINSLNLSSLGTDNIQQKNSKNQTVKVVQLQPQHLSNSGKFFNKRAYKGSVLPAISSK